MGIVEKQVIRFAPTRKLQGRSIDLGNAGDNMVRRLLFVLPEVDAAQTATLMYGGKYADMIQLTYEDGKWVTDLTAEMVGEAGEVEGYVRVDGPEGEKWHSDAFRLVTGEVPEIEVQIEKLYPTAVDQMLTAMAEHRVEMDAAVERAEAAADRADGAASGKAGGYYKPSVVGDMLTWEASEDYMPEVPGANVRGPKGEPGEKGETGAQGDSGPEGPAGDDGFSPTVAVTEITGGHRVTITDVNGPKSFDVADGKDGTGGSGGSGADGEDGGYYQPSVNADGDLSWSASKAGMPAVATVNIRGPQGTDGSPGKDGQDGENGFSPTVAVTEITGGHRVSVTDANGTKTFDVMDGAEGPAGSDATVTVDSTVTEGGTNPVNSAAVIAYAMPVTAIVFTETDPGDGTASSHPDGTVVLVP